jgi:hypothetical protein
MASDDETQFKLDLDATDFIAQANEAAQSVQGIGSKDNLSDLVEGLGEVGGLVGVLGTAFFAVKESMDAVFDAEKINQVNAQFESLSSNAGLFSDKLKSGLIDSSHGWVDETTLMQSANKALTELQGGAGQLPEAMAVARQATSVFGGDVTTNFENIAQAVATGNTRILRHMGLIVDAQGAYKEYAKSIGVTVDSLTKADQQQALMNAVLEQGKEKFKDVNDGLVPATSAWNEFKATMKEVGEIVTLAWNKIAGPTVLANLRGLQEMASDAKSWFQDKFGSGAEQAAAHVKRLDVSVRDLKGRIMELQDIQENDKNTGSASYQDRAKLIDELNQKLKTYQNELGQTAVAQKKLDDSQKSKVDESANKEKEENLKARLEKQKAQEQKYNKEIEQLNKEQTKIDIGDMETIEQANKLYKQQQLQDAQEIQSKIDQVEQKRKAGTLTDKQADKEVAMLHKQMVNSQIQDDAQLTKMQTQALDNYQAKSANTFQGIGRGFETMSQKNKMALQDFGSFGEKTANSFGSHMTNAFSQIGAGSKSASDAMEQAFAGMVGDMATQYGQMMMLASILPPDPAGFAAGAALIALGGMLGSVGGGGASSLSAGSPSTGTAGTPGTVNNPASPSPNTGAGTGTPGTGTQIIIQGSVLGDDATARWVVSQVRAASDAQGFTSQSVQGGF